MTEQHAGRKRQERRATYGEVFAVPEFRALWSAQMLSVVGDQLAQVALAVLVYDRTGSALLTGLTYALTFLPQIVGGPVLASLADRFPRRTVMIVCDIARVPLVALMAAPGMPFAALCVLLFFVQLVAAPFAAARAALVPDVLPGDRYVLGTAVTNITHQAAQVLGFAVGGAVVGVVGTHNALAIDAATFAVSALVLRLGVQARPAVTGQDTERSSLLASTVAGARIALGDRRLRALIALAWLCGFYVVPEGLAAPYAATLGGHAVTVGLLMAAAPTGTVIGMLVFTRFVAPASRLRLMGPLALLSCAPLVGSAFQPALVVTLLLWTISGFGSSYQLAANAAAVAAMPASARGRVFGLAQAGILAVQGLGILIAGAAAQVLGPEPVVAIFGGAGLAVAFLLWASWSRASSMSDIETEPSTTGDTAAPIT